MNLVFLASSNEISVEKNYTKKIETENKVRQDFPQYDSTVTG